MKARLARTLRTLKRVFWGRKTRWFVVVPVILAVSSFAFYLTVRPDVLPQQTIFFLDDVVLPEEGQVVLVFAPHPDDETIGAGGYIAASIANGATVHIVLVTDGSKGPGNSTGTRYLEFRRATRILGVTENNLTFMGLPDGKLRQEDPNTLRTRLEEQIVLHSPNIVVFPDTRDAHQDHRTIGRAIEQILSQQSPTVIAYQYLVHYEMFFPQPRKFDPNLYLLPPIRLVDFDKAWQRFMLSQDAQDAKVAATYAYRSQLRNPELRSLLLSSIRKNELFSIPRYH